MGECVLTTHPDALEAIAAVEAETWRRHYAPPPVLSLSEWADANRIISPPNPEPGPWRTDRAPYLREPMDCISDPGVREIVLMWGSQLGKTEIIHNTIGYYAHQDPTGVLIVRPGLDEAKAWSKERLAPMFHDSPALRGILTNPRSRDSGNTILIKQFTGGWLAIVGSNSPSGLASRPARVVIADEWDRFESSAGTEGDPIKLARVRQRNYWNRLFLGVSSPGVTGISKTAARHELGDQRVYEVPCPHCETYQVLGFWKPEGETPRGFLHWDEGQPSTAAYCCVECGELIEERYKAAMLKRGRWVAQNPGGTFPSFQLSALYSPWMRWQEVVNEWYEAQGMPEDLQVFVNTVLAETWTERVGQGTTPAGILSRREDYGKLEVPTGVQVLTAGVDVQADRLEVIVRGWGPQWESWLIAREILIGDPSRVDVWNQLEAVRKRTWMGEREFVIYAMAVDSGYLTNEVYTWTKPRYGQRVYATKGSSQPGGALVSNKPTLTNRLGAPVFIVGTETGKDSVYARLKIHAPGPGYMHLPLWADEDYAEQVTAEKVVPRRHYGRVVKVYELIRGERNEVLDCEVLAWVALQITRWRPKPTGSQATTAEPERTAPKPEKMAVVRRRKQPGKSSWINSWRG